MYILTIGSKTLSISPKMVIGNPEISNIIYTNCKRFNLFNKVNYFVFEPLFFGLFNLGYIDKVC